GDPGRLRQVLTNLIGNAVKFTEHGEVSVLTNLKSESADDAVLHFTINDTGPGITKKSLGRLFAAFYQADSPSSRRYGGTGLGLAISAQIVEVIAANLKDDRVVGEGAYVSLGAMVR